MYNQYIPAGNFRPVEPEPTPSGSGFHPGGGGLLERLLGGVLGGKSGGGTSGFGGLGSLFKLDQLDRGDILLVLILIYLFRESEDDEWLIILALVLLMGL